MKVVFLTQYFYPETGAPQNRLFSLAKNLQEFTPNIEILTAFPNYPKMEIYDEYKGKMYQKDSIEGLTIWRSWIFVAKTKRIVLRLLNYFSFVISSFIVGLIKLRKVDVIFCESPPLFLGLSAYALSRLKGAKLVFNVSDLWPESAEKLDLINNKQLLKLTYGLEKWLYKKSHLVTGQTQGIVNNINNRFPDIDAYWFRNGIDLKRYDTSATPDAFREKYGFTGNEFVLLYAGIIGYAQGLDVILEAAKNLSDKPEIRFVLMGDGPELPRLKARAQEIGLSNILFTGNVNRHEIPTAVAACNAYVVPLKKSDLFLGAIPSKLFEPLVMKKPILLGVDGEARTLFIDEGNGGLFYKPDDSDELTNQIETLRNDRQLLERLGENGHNYVLAKFDRSAISTEFWNMMTSRLKL